MTVRNRNGNELGFGDNAVSVSKCLDVLAKEGGEAKVCSSGLRQSLSGGSIQKSGGGPGCR